MDEKEDRTIVIDYHTGYGLDKGPFMLVGISTDPHKI